MARSGGYHGPRILIIGEGPGELEDHLGRPFVGYSGRILDFMIESVRVPFKYIITNMVCCRPQTLTLSPAYYDDIYLTETSGGPQNLKQLSKLPSDHYEISELNREPTPAEMKACKPHIDELVQSFRPQGIVHLGLVAENYSTSLPNIALYHPAYIGRQEYKLLPTLQEAVKLEEFIIKLDKTLTKEYLHA